MTQSRLARLEMLAFADARGVTHASEPIIEETYDRVFDEHAVYTFSPTTRGSYAYLDPLGSSCAVLATREAVSLKARTWHNVAPTDWEVLGIDEDMDRIRQMGSSAIQLLEEHEYIAVRGRLAPKLERTSLKEIFSQNAISGEWENLPYEQTQDTIFYEPGLVWRGLRDRGLIRGIRQERKFDKEERDQKDLLTIIRAFRALNWEPTRLVPAAGLGQ
jgi:hypothetical protein